MIEIDGSQKSGSGTILRLSIALAAIKGESLHISNIRQNRPKPGLKPQHLEAVLTAARLCNAQLEGATPNSTELHFTPQKIKGGTYNSSIGTAGNIPMLIMTVLPICIFADKPVQLKISKGGTDTIHAPTINYMKYVLLASLRKMGVKADITIKRYGYYPKGMGEVTLTVEPSKNLNPFRIERFGELQNIKGISVCTFLSRNRVAERQAQAAKEHLAQNGFNAEIEVINDESNPQQKGSSIVLWAQTSTGALIGADNIGELGKPAEKVGKEASKKLLKELNAKSTADENLTDMLIPYMSLQRNSSVILTREITDHIESTIWLAQKFLNTEFKIKKTDDRYRIEKLAE